MKTPTNDLPTPQQVAATAAIAEFGATSMEHLASLGKAADDYSKNPNASAEERISFCSAVAEFRAQLEAAGRDLAARLTLQRPVVPMTPAAPVPQRTV
jgi:hypothetical protein